MPWEKTFDIDTAIDQATEVFWSKGYEETSLSDLLQAIGINKGSFYNAFGSKKQLFTQSLEKYEKEKRRDVFVELEAMNDPIKAINTLFDELIKQSLTDKERKGCFLVNTALDLPHHDSDIQKTVTKSLQSTEAFFEGQIIQGIKTGAISKEKDPKTQAKALLTLLVGLRVLARGVFDETGLQAIKSQALASIQ